MMRCFPQLDEGALSLETLVKNGVSFHPSIESKRRKGGTRYALGCRTKRSRKSWRSWLSSFIPYQVPYIDDATTAKQTNGGDDSGVLVFGLARWLNILNF